jgi:hypothetical protein
LLCNLQNPLTGSFVDSGAPMQGAIYRPDRNLRQFRDQVDSASLFRHFPPTVVDAGAAVLA